MKMLTAESEYKNFKTGKLVVHSFLKLHTIYWNTLHSRSLVNPYSNI